jgi:Tfp pilus assembly protein PilX
MNTNPSSWTRGDPGVAMILAILLLLLLSGIGVAVVDHSGEESAVTGSTRRSSFTFYAADSGIQLSIARVSQFPPQLNAFSATFADGTTMQSGGRASPAPEPIQRTNIGAPPDGYSIVAGSGYVTETYRATVTAFRQGGASTELEAKYSKMQSAGSYR